MKNWSSILLESMLIKKIDKDIESKIKNDQLYHLTNKEAAKNIMTHNYFRPSLGTIHKKGLSTTFDPTYVWGRGEIRFVLSYKKLKSDYELMFVDEGLNGVDESEIKVMSDSAIMNARKYIIDIIYKGSDASLKDQIDSFLSED